MKKINIKKALIIAGALFFTLPWIGVGVLEWKISSQKSEKIINLNKKVCLKIPPLCSLRGSMNGDLSIICRDGSFATMKLENHNKFINKNFLIKRDNKRSNGKDLSVFQLILREKLFNTKVFYKNKDKEKIGLPFICKD